MARAATAMMDTVMNSHSSRASQGVFRHRFPLPAWENDRWAERYPPLHVWIVAAMLYALFFYSAVSTAAPNTDGLPPNVEPWWPSRYGQDDQIGSLNEITPAITARATSLVKQGRTIDLGRILDADVPKFPGRYWQQTIDATAPYTNLQRSDASPFGWGENHINWITEIQAGTFQVGTQLDSLGHLQIADRFYNGWRAREMIAADGLRKFGMETVPPVVTRGVLLDIAALKQVARLDRGYVITVDDLRRAAKQHGITVAAGDAVLIHTGWGGLWNVDNAKFLSGEPGVGLAAAAWLYDQHIALTGADTWSYGAVPGEDPRRPFEVPQTMYVKWGLVGLENLATEELAKHRIYEFLFVLTHAKTRGSTAAVIAPAAVY
jgi:kynurenine formamidase